MDQNSSLVSKFDFNSQAGITAVLFSVRQSELSSDEKNEIRDLIFSYTNGGGEESVKIALEQKLSAHNIKLVLAKASSTTPVNHAPALPFGSYRPTPSFRVPVVPRHDDVVNNVVDAPIPAVVSPVPVPEVVVPVQAPVVSVPPVIEQLVPVEAPVPVVSAPVIQEKIVPAPITSTPQVTVPIQPAPASQSTVNTKYLDRIREIKSSVNSKVGNPVNLVDIDNEIGREYMNALLEAMKKLNGGSIAELDKAMQRLELSFIAVEEAIIDHEKKVEEKPIQQPFEPNKQTSVDTSAFVPVPTPVSVPTPVLTPIAAPQIFTSVVDEPQIIENILPPAPKPDPVFNSPEPIVTNAPSSFNIASIGAEASGYSSPGPVNNVELRKIPSLAEEKKNLTPQDLPERLSNGSDTISNPLFSGEIDSGLDQLLSDWSLFKKSGLFGSGPKGREHPLYLKISGLQIPLLLAGRFEGANQEIKQSITDYMNGWRYEQGIIYEQGETFEMYLRRVIKHILDLQKRRNPS